MSLKRFNTDFSNASQKVAVGAVVDVEGLTKGDSEGEVIIDCRHESCPHPILIRALAQAVDEYPDNNTYLLFTDDEDPPQPVGETLNRIQDYLYGMRVYEMVTEVSRNLHAALNETSDGKTTKTSSGSQKNDQEGEEDEADEESFGFGDSDEDNSDDEFDLDDDAFGLNTAKRTSSRHASHHSSEEQLQMRWRLRQDLRLAKQAGYKVGILNGMRHSGTEGIVSISIRAQKLGLSGEAKEAWDVEDNEYVVLLIRFGFYTPVERVMEQASTFTPIYFRIGKCSRYKPSFKSALAAFDLTAFGERKTQDRSNEPSGHTEPDQEFRKLFISNSLNQYLNDCFISLLKLRKSRKCSWDDANLILESKTINQTTDSILTHDHSGSGGETMDVDPAPEDLGHRTIPSDHLAQTPPQHGHSLPLIAMEFAMNYFVKCTEYCLRCHQKVDKSFEALRPYVCSKPLCLFQYMAMGLGPNVEHEILTEPYVVDLLVNLCYSALDPSSHSYNQPFFPAAPRPNPTLPIRELPVGLRMTIPNLLGSDHVPLKAHLSKGPERHVLVFDVEASFTMDDRVGLDKWIAFRRPGENKTQHAVISEVDLVKRSLLVNVVSESGDWSPSGYGVAPSHGEPTSASDDTLVHVFLYDTDLDSLPLLEKGGMLRHVLDTMPPILDIAAFLTRQPHASLRSMDKMSVAAASLLQWIVSSNRSCIYQVGSFEEISRTTQNAQELANSVPLIPTTRRKNRDHERIPGMPGWVQFRFAQGSPDKELRFKRALQEVAARQNIASHPTIFAWHGSGLSNWHSIVRNGLDFNDIKNGRSFGNGVYFSPHHGTSMGYSGIGRRGIVWGKSALGFSTCVSLNEIINCPSEFVSRSPHYVVSQLDWHQCRYIFVQAAACGEYGGVVNPSPVGSVSNNQQFHKQPDGLAITGPSGQALRIPLAAIPFRLVDPGLETQPVATKRTTVRREEEESAEEDLEDVQFLFSDNEESEEPRGPPSKKTTAPGRPVTPANTDTLTDFRPGSLDLSTLPTMAMPKSASDFATKAIVRELKRLEEIQSRTSLHELGWYMDFEKMDNMFQWIVEFHSFDPSLPLTQDMKQLGVTSIVFEIRFGANYPMSPPFVRVIRPHFLPFMQGGGGHVTAGGAMCMELLTNSGWSPANSMESVFLQVRMALQNLEPKPARLSRAIRGSNSAYGPAYVDDYRVGDAIEAYTRAARVHGWEVPADLHQIANGL